MRARTGIACSTCFTLLTAVLPAAAVVNVSIGGLIGGGIYRGFDGTAQAAVNAAISCDCRLGPGRWPQGRLPPERTFRYRYRAPGGSGPQAVSGTTSPRWAYQGGFGHLRLGRALSAMWSQDWKFDPWAEFPTAFPRPPGIPSGTTSRHHRPLQQQRHRQYGPHGQWHLHGSPTVAGFCPCI